MDKGRAERVVIRPPVGPGIWAGLGLWMLAVAALAIVGWLRHATWALPVAAVGTVAMGCLALLSWWASGVRIIGDRLHHHLGRRPVRAAEVVRVESVTTRGGTDVAVVLGDGRVVALGMGDPGPGATGSLAEITAWAREHGAQLEQQGSGAPPFPDGTVLRPSRVALWWPVGTLVVGVIAVVMRRVLGHDVPMWGWAAVGLGLVLVLGEVWLNRGDPRLELHGDHLVSHTAWRSVWSVAAQDVTGMGLRTESTPEQTILAVRGGGALTVPPRWGRRTREATRHRLRSWIVAHGGSPAPGPVRTTLSGRGLVRSVLLLWDLYGLMAAAIGRLYSLVVMYGLGIAAIQVWRYLRGRSDSRSASDAT